MVHPSVGEFLWMQQQQGLQEQWLRDQIAMDDATASAAAHEEREHQWAALLLRVGGG